MIQERAGNWAAAIATCEQVYRNSIEAGDIESLLTTLARLGDNYRQAGERELAEEHLELAFVVAELHGDANVAGRALNALGMLKQSHGDLAGAEEAYLCAREFIVQAGDPWWLGGIEQNLGTLANIRGDLTTALHRYQSGLKYLEEAGHDRGRASVFNNLGMLHVDLCRLDEAEVYFQQALDICSKISDRVTAGIVHLNRTEMFLARGDPDRARATCDEAFEIASRLSDNIGKAEALKFYGIIYRETGKVHLAETHLHEALRIAGGHDPLLEAETQREMALVLRAQDRNREALTALNRAHALFSQIRAEHDQADVNQRIAKLEGDFLALVRSWGESIEAKDRYTGGHCQRVADYACRIAQEVGMVDGDIDWFRMGAFLHDVGKIEVPAEILNKPGRLTAEERATMERHTVIGDEILAPLEFPWDIRPMVRSHHERWDGSGYPDRLVGEEIPHTARILRIADVFDALTTARSYRRPLTP
ncbi:MAG: tetratricopeptide repeat protein, partial [Gemmatimonadota bacterium]|nr:tetratricopeptide repeat protein [Gemmatimonadota bacterium]